MNPEIPKQRIAVIDGSPRSLTARIIAVLGDKLDERPTAKVEPAYPVIRRPPRGTSTPWGMAPMNRAMRRAMRPSRKV